MNFGARIYFAIYRRRCVLFIVVIIMILFGLFYGARCLIKYYNLDLVTSILPIVILAGPMLLTISSLIISILMYLHGDLFADNSAPIR
jgi:hypothetical protein